MQFRTEINLPPSERLLDPRRPMVLLGSCFAENIGQKMRDALWEVTINPCGVLYNPYSIGQAVLHSMMPPEIRMRAMTESLVERDGLWFSWLFDSSISGQTRQECIDRGMEAYQLLHDKLLEAQGLILSHGTAWVYRLKSTGYPVVSNCHKFPADRFERRLLTVREINEWSDIVNATAGQFLSHKNVIQTVSPVRHLNDGPVGNTLSKATLVMSCTGLSDDINMMEYFPSYEILNDDLRDYRFYCEDLVHPNQMAVDYIWDKFLERYLSEEDRKYVREGEALSRRMKHRALHPGSPGDIAFREETERLLRERE